MTSLATSPEDAPLCRRMPPRFCLMCYEHVTLVHHNTCPSCRCSDCMVDPESDLAKRTFLAPSLASGVKVLGNDVLQDIAESMRQMINFRSHVKVEDVSDHYGPNARRVGSTPQEPTPSSAVASLNPMPTSSIWLRR